MTFVVRLPDVGEGVAEAELVEWHVAVGDAVTPDTVLAQVLTDKATVEIYPPVEGVVAELHGEPGDVLAVGGPLATLETTAADTPTPDTTSPSPENEHASPARVPDTPGQETEGTSTDDWRRGPEAEAASPDRAPDTAARTRPSGRVLASPAVRARARDLGIDLATVSGTGPSGQVTHRDLDRLLTSGGMGNRGAARGDVRDDVDVQPVRGLRRRIAERLSAAWAEIPHITYVDAVDATDLEALRATLNEQRRDRQPKLTLLPFIARAIVLAVADQPAINAHYDAAAGTLSTFGAVHLGVATQTDDGLVVPVLRHAEALGIWETAAEIARLATAARDGSATREELSGSTITVTSLGALGGLVTTPIINAPEVAIVGINKLETRPVWRDGAFVPRQMFNVSASFDHRIVDGWDAATFVQRLRQLLETPALLFID